ncbi:hypothetical protein TB1_033657 [Malus domestica]
MRLDIISLRAIVIGNMHESFSSSGPYFRAVFKLVEKGFKLRVFLEDLRYNRPLPLRKVMLKCFHVEKVVQSHSCHFLAEQLLFQGFLVVFFWHIDGEDFVT